MLAYGFALNSCSTIAIFAVKNLGNCCVLLCGRLGGDTTLSEFSVAKVHYYRGETCEHDI